ncbi:secretion/conjugation apparatus DotM-related subunit [Pseudomonas aeruginosa]
MEPEGGLFHAYKQLMVAFTLGRWLQSHEAMVLSRNEDELGVRRLMQEHWNFDFLVQAEESHAYWRTAILGSFDLALKVMPFVDRKNTFKWLAAVDQVLYIALVSRLEQKQPWEIAALVFHTKKEVETGAPIVFDGLQARPEGKMPASGESTA